MALNTNQPNQPNQLLQYFSYIVGGNKFYQLNPGKRDDFFINKNVLYPYRNWHHTLHLSAKFMHKTTDKQNKILKMNKNAI